MLTKDDKSWIVVNFVTRGEFHSEMKDVKESLVRIEKLASKTLGITDHRHGIQIQKLATATGTKLSR